MLSQAFIINGYFCMFDLKEIEDRIEQSEKTLNAISVKMKDMRNDFNEIYSELENKDDTYFEEHLNERNELNEKIRVIDYSKINKNEQKLKNKFGIDKIKIVYFD